MGREGGNERVAMETTQLFGLCTLEFCPAET